VPLNETEKAYLAGIIDGEGCVGLGVRLKKYITPTLQITNTDERLMLWLVEHCGGKVYPRLAEGRPTRKPSWLWSVAGQKARTVIETAQPYLVLKAAQAEIVLRAYAKNGRRPGRDSLGRLKGSLSADDLAANIVAIGRIRSLNKRGR
jgi:hypothetical protein